MKTLSLLPMGALALAMALPLMPQAASAQEGGGIGREELREFLREGVESRREMRGSMMEGMRDDVPANRQAATYGAGVAAQKGGEPWAEFANASLPLLFQACQRPDAREDDHLFATENACASIAKILHFNSGKVGNAQEVVTHWLDTLPVTNDEEAAPFAYSFLAQLIDQ